MNLKTNLLALLLLLVGAVALNAQTQTPVAVYTSTNTQYYRIPAIVTASNGDLLLFNDDRHTSNSDVGSNNSNSGIDLLVKRLNWDGSAYGSIGASLNVTPNKPQATWCYGDPAVVADRESDEVLVLAIGGTTSWTSNTTSYAIRSHNNGQTWDAPVQMTFGSANFPRPTDNYVNGFFFASGRILQSKVIKVGSYYRIYVAFLYTTVANTSDSYKFNQVYYSDDFGSTWNLLGGKAITSADEAKLEELPNGDVIITSRYAGGRRINKFTYSDRTTFSSGSWGTQDDYQFTGGCAINADMLTMTAYRTRDNKQVTLLLLSTATGSSRTDIKIFYHEIDNNTTVASLTSGWTATSFTLPNTSTFGGYSALTMQADEKIGVYYEGNTTTNGVNDYSNLYYITYTLEELTGNAYTLTDPNPPVVVVPDVEVPDDEVPVYEWHGTNSPYWNDPLNWTVINAVNNTPLARGMVPPTPDENSNVKIEAPGDGEYNPVLDAPLTINNLYVAPGAAIGNQYWLRVKERVYTDVEIPTNQWVRMSMPLRDTYSGDMYTTTQGGVMPDDEFTAATYNPSDGNSGNNRVFPYAIYQRVFSDAVNVMTDDQTGTEVRQLNSSWSVPYNDLAAKYQVAEGFDLWAPSTNATATFRFPSATDEYAYYYSNGNASTRKETVNHAASGTMAYGNSGNGVMDVTITRAKRAEDAGVPMYAVGNPSFSYLDVAEFIRVNAYGASHQGDASVVGNITPYVYKYNEDNPGSTGEAGETIYYLDNDKKLYTVSPTSVSDNTIPTGGNTTQVAANSTEKYVAPTRGFRVMAGQAEVSAVEPKLIGNYNTSTFKLADLRYSTNASMSNATTNTYFYVSSVPHSSTGIYTSSLALTVAVGSSADEVVMSGFCYSSILRGKVDPAAQTITVTSGTPVGYQFEGLPSSNATWKDPSHSGANNRNIYAWDGTKAVSTSTIGGFYVEYAAGLSAQNPLVFDYTIAQNGSVTITARSGFAIYTGSGECPLSYMYLSTAGKNYPLALNAYNSFTATASRETAEDSYINPDMFGTYSYKVVENKNAPGVTAGNTYTFSISPVEGSYNAVRISNFFAGTATSKDDILGYISESNGQYTLTIPGSQVVANGSSNNFADFYAFYKRDRAGDVVLDWNAQSKVFTIRDNDDNGTIQVSGFDANPNGSTFLGYYANGLNLNTSSGTSSLSSNPINSSANLKDKIIMMKYNNNNNYYIGFNGSNFSTTSNPTINDNTYLFELVPNGSNYLIKNKNGYYYSAGNSSWVKASSSAAVCTVTYDVNNSGWTIKVNNKYLYLNASSLATANSARYWTFYDVSTIVNVIPQTAPYAGGSTTVDPTIGQFEPGSNYEAINLKFTAGMFDANPGNNQSASSAPRKSAAQGSTMASVTLKDGNRTANTLITRRENGHNGYNAFEDASLIDVNDNAKSIATLAGNQMVAVNTLGDTTAVQLVLNNANGNVALTFDNLAALGSNARLFDATTGSETPLDANHQELTVNMTVNDSPLRYSIIWDVVSGTEEVELPVTDGDLWFKALSTAKGTIKVTSSENMASVRLYDSTGKLVGSKVNAQNETMFEYLLSGIYVVEVSNGSETQSMKVNVK